MILNTEWLRACLAAAHAEILAEYDADNMLVAKVRRNGADLWLRIEDHGVVCFEEEGLYAGGPDVLTRCVTTPANLAQWAGEVIAYDNRANAVLALLRAEGEVE